MKSAPSRNDQAVHGIAESLCRWIAAQPPKNLGLQQDRCPGTRRPARGGIGRRAPRALRRSALSRLRASCSRSSKSRSAAARFASWNAATTWVDLPTDQRQETASSRTLDQGMRISAGGIEVGCLCVQAGPPRPGYPVPWRTARHLPSLRYAAKPLAVRHASGTARRMRASRVGTLGHRPRQAGRRAAPRVPPRSPRFLAPGMTRRSGNARNSRHGPTQRRARVPARGSRRRSGRPDSAADSAQDPRSAPRADSRPKGRAPPPDRRRRRRPTSLACRKSRSTSSKISAAASWSAIAAPGSMRASTGYGVSSRRQKPWIVVQARASSSAAAADSALTLRGRRSVRPCKLQLRRSSRRAGHP